MRTIVVVFDICSSTIIIENLIQNDRINDYSVLVDGYWAFLNSKRNEHSFSLYKFLGDGFILLFDDRENIDDIMLFCNELTVFSQQLLAWYKNQYLDITQLPREGITTGIAAGNISEINTINLPSSEYIGRPINVACRLQKTLSEPEHSNKVLLHPDAYRQINDHLTKKACKETTRSLRNILGNTEIRCYEYNPITILNQNWNSLNSPSTVTEKIIKDPNTSKKLTTQLSNITVLARQLLSSIKKK